MNVNDAVEFFTNMQDAGHGEAVVVVGDDNAPEHVGDLSFGGIGRVDNDGNVEAAVFTWHTGKRPWRDVTEEAEPRADVHATRRWVVCVNQPGCLPENEPYVVVGDNAAADAILEEHKRDDVTELDRDAILDDVVSGGYVSMPADDGGHVVSCEPLPDPMLIPGLGTLHPEADLRNGDVPAYAWPGGYAIGYVTADGGLLCASCVNANAEVGVSEETPADWRIVGIATADTAEEPMVCDHGGEPIWDPAD